MYYNVLQTFHDVLPCLTMFYDVYRVAQQSATIGIADRVATDCLRDRDNAARIGYNAAGIGDHVEETLTSGEYVSQFLISIWN